MELVKATHGCNLETIYKSKINDNWVLKPIELRWSCCLLNHNYIRKLGNTLIIKFIQKNWFLVTRLLTFQMGHPKEHHFPLNVKRWLQCNALNNSTYTTNANPLATLSWNLHLKSKQKNKNNEPSSIKSQAVGQKKLHDLPLI